MWINTYHDTAKKVTANPDKENLASLKALVDREKPESDEAALELLKKHRRNYENIYGHLEKLTTNVSENEIIPHHATAQVLLDLCRGERKWVVLTEEERNTLTKNRRIQNLRESELCLKTVLTKKLICSIRKGKITRARTFTYQDIGKVIESVELSDGEWMVTREDIETLIETII